MSCNFLQPRATDMRGSDTLSEISESGTTNSGWTSGWDSREDLRDFITKIGLKDSSELYKDRFRVDRRKLEQMLSGDNEAPLPADIFFEQIMEDTNTFITWPSKLKIGAKSKKDPHVRIAGRHEDVEVAKERIMTALDTRSNRVTMKMDVSYTDHSHIIGKGGLSIRRVMLETQCHIHFPDSNRSNSNEKSNQVSIAGDIQGVELARSRVRQKTPVIFGFELPIMSQDVDASSQYLLRIQEQYGVQMILRTRPKLHATLVLIKGVEWEIEQVKKATILFVEYLCEHLANQIPIQMTMEISPMHHQMVIGKNHQNLKDIMQTTGTQILIPDAQDPNIPILKKSNVTITGNIHNVYAARQILTGSLPLLLMFDLPESLSCYKPGEIVEIQTKFDVVINIRHKAKQNTMVCIIKAAERNATNIYRARNAILAVDEPNFIADIPASYHKPLQLHSQTQSGQTGQSGQSQHDLLTPTPLNPHPMSPLISPTWHYPSTSFGQAQALPQFVGLTMGNQQPQFTFNCSVGSASASASASGNGIAQSSMSSSGYHSLGQFSASSLSLEQSRDASTLSTISSNSSSLSNKSSPVSSPARKNAYHPRNYQEILKGVAELNTADPSAGNEKVSDYESKRMAGFMAMQNRPTGNQFRYPNNSWAGYGISMTSPAPLEKSAPAAAASAAAAADKDDDIWKSPTKDFASPTSKMNTSNFMDHTPGYLMNRITSAKWPDLPSLLTSIGCEKYIGLFNSHEVDLLTFASINDQDLVTLGVNIFGCRRRMLLAISELNKRENPFSPAPGAERKAGSSSSSTISSNFSPREKW